MQKLLVDSRSNLPSKAGFQPQVNVGDEIKPHMVAVKNINVLQVNGLHYSIDTAKLLSGEFDLMNEHRLVVIKRELKELNNREDILREAGVYNRLKTFPHAAKFLRMYYFQTMNFPCYIVLERFGNSLSSIFKRGCDIRPIVLERLVLAVNVLHDCGFVHCDLKPQNVLVLVHVDGTVDLKLCDLDSATPVEELFPHDEISGRLKYTEQWVVPEVFFGKGGVLRATYAIDVFAMGLIAAAFLDDNVHENKTILPPLSNNPELYTALLSDQEKLWQQMQCGLGQRYTPIVHAMCRIQASERLTSKDVCDALHSFRGTALHKQVSDILIL
jgi:serine/threonine protein kinase